MKKQNTPCIAVIINYQTPDLVLRAFHSFHKFYPALPIILADNGSQDSSKSVLLEIQQSSPSRIEVVFFERNLHHGPAMDAILHRGSSKYVLFIDSDCEILQGGFIEKMIEVAEQQPGVFAVGKKIFINKRGYDIAETKGAIPYIRPFCMLVHREHYQHLTPFRKHGSPCLQTMREAALCGYALLDFPVLEYVQHKGRGTVERYGYQLGLNGKLNHLLHWFGL
ncbi:MAG: glycosyltransferase family 2 protein [Ignavibacteriales bacterium]|nr:glycosyltransferase family 2 protein [Ignavibacteriales bacterium]